MIPYELLNNLHFIKGLDPVADAFSGTATSDVVSMANHQSAIFLVYKGVGTTGTSTITVEACDDVVPTNTTAIPFYSKSITSTDVQGALTARAAAGFATTAGSSQIYVIQVAAEAVAAAGYHFVRLKAVEVVDSPVLGGIAIALAGPRFGGSTTSTEID
jgi:hypothetical protein